MWMRLDLTQDCVCTRMRPPQTVTPEGRVHKTPAIGMGQEALHLVLSTHGWGGVSCDLRAPEGRTLC